VTTLVGGAKVEPNGGTAVGPVPGVTLIVGPPGTRVTNWGGVACPDGGVGVPPGPVGAAVGPTSGVQYGLWQQALFGSWIIVQ